MEMAAFITKTDAASILGMDVNDPTLQMLCDTADNMAREFIGASGVAQVEAEATFPPAVKFACALIIPALTDAVTHSGRQLTAEAIGDYRATYAKPDGDGLASFCPAAAALLRPYRTPNI
jgi:hypothetical protein